jgi:small subunit ribosomal protein S6
MVRRQRSAGKGKHRMALYEHVFLVRQDVAQSQVDALAETASKIITDNGGKIVKTESWGLRTLAYRIAKNRKAHYVMIEFEAPGNVVLELERQIQIDEDIVRYMTLRVDAHEAGPSAMMRKRDRDDRPRREDGDRPRRDERPRRDDRDLEAA